MGKRMRRSVAACVSVVAVSLVLAGSGAADPSAGCATTAAGTTCVFAFTGAEQSWTVPAGVTSASVVAFGASGGQATAFGGAAGGKGAQVGGDLAVSGGQVLYVEVGGTATTTGACASADCVGGFNGGGSSIFGGGGGGASDVRTVSGSLASRVLVAAGGGGGGEGAPCVPDDNNGGQGGDSAGAGGTGSGPGGSGGGAGGSSTGGTAGSPSGSAGTLGAGGPGGGNTGGGGGGGVYGGGGGGDVVDISFSPLCVGGAGGGGGGSNLGPGGASIQNGVRSGNGLVTISYAATSGELLSALADKVADLAPKSALQKLVKQIQGYVDDNNTKKACKSFNGFASRVKGMVKVKKLSSSEAAELNQLAQAVQNSLGC